MRDGYDPKFLGNQHEIKLPEPGLVLQSDVLQPPKLPDGETVVPYVHYSLLMSKSTKQALYSAANVDSTQEQSVPGRKGRNWFIDPRVGRENQIPNYPYQGSLWDRGHLTRRTAVTWGPDVSLAIKASNDSCAYTNACMQHKNFNEDDWRTVETLVSEFEGASKLTVMTGPVFTQSDRYFAKEFDDDPVRIPAAFWKTLSYVGTDGELKTQAYIFFQDLPSISERGARARIELSDMQITTTELSLWTGLEFDKAQFDSNPLKFYGGPEALSVKKRKKLLKDNPGGVQLTAGIPTTGAAAFAREALPLDDFYDLIHEVSWI
jgi:endonuclease G